MGDNCKLKNTVFLSSNWKNYFSSNWYIIYHLMHINCVFSGPKSKNSDFENKVRWVFPKIDGHSSTGAFNMQQLRKEPVMVCFFNFKSSYLSFGLKFRYILMA